MFYLRPIYVQYQLVHDPDHLHKKLFTTDDTNTYHTVIFRARATDQLC